ncbi:uncharacterized protein LOC124938661 [Impatiens glandulifera]|uniref:uncharacterized protein LOC124938661 n=1 Tax=Impatiens glandulifera TaxID=253017 RepID=UPI001FB11D35|nr:uncharacterized protein LOC124938661 [Impatiens glandulifera]
MPVSESEGLSEECAEIVTTADCLDGSLMFHLVTDILGFVLFMHQQIPSPLQDICFEFDTLQTNYKELETELEHAELRASSRRKHIGRMREVKQGIKRLHKLMNSFSSFRTSLQLVISEIPAIQCVIVTLGPSPIRPLHVYELRFAHGKVTSAGDFETKSKAADGLSRKAIRSLISKGAGANSYAGPTKLFMLIKAPSSFNHPQHFLPKRDFKYNKKIVPFRLRIKCRSQDQEVSPQTADSDTNHRLNSISNDFIWFQCRHVITGIASRASPTEE